MIRNLRISLAVLFMACTTTAALNAQMNVELVNSGEILLEGDLYYALGRYSKAISLYQKVGRNDTNYALVLRDLALAYSDDKEDSLCLLTARRGMTLKSQYDADFYNLAGISLKEMEKYDSSLAVFDAGIAKYPYMYLLRYNKGMAYVKMKKYPEAQECFQKAIENNPYHALSHFMLGKTCVEQGRLVPAILSYEYYLMLEPNSRSDRSIKVVSTLEDLYAGDYQPDPDFQMTITEAGDGCFSDITELIESKVAFKDTYKNKTKINLRMVKQFQAMLEKMHYEANTGNWWMEYYVPFFVELQKQDFLAPYASFTLLSAADNNPSVRKSIKKNKKKIGAFAVWAGKFIKDHIRHPAKELFPQDTKLTYTFYDNNVIASAGPSDEKGLEHGEWIFFYGRSGHVLGKGKYEHGKRTGEWIYYYSDGTLREKTNFVNDLRDGPSEEYYSSGIMSYKTNYVKGQQDGEYTVYGVHGGIKEKATMKAGKLDGVATTYYKTGGKQMELPYSLGKLNGELVYYTIDGKVQKRTNYVADKRQGKSTEYYSTGAVKAEGDYKGDEPFGTWKYYWDNGKLLREGSYKDKGLRDGVWKEYFRDGVISVEAKFTAGKYNGDYRDYDYDGKVYCYKLYAADKVKKLVFYDKKGDVIDEFNTTKEVTVTEYHPNGEKSGVGDYVDGQRHGEWSEYSRNGGWLTAKQRYRRGYLHGTRTEYFPNGKEASELDYSYGERDGYLKSWYQNGTLEQEGWYVDGERQGDWYEYNQRGVIVSHFYYLNGSPFGYQEQFDEKGRKEEESRFRDGCMWTRTRYDSTGAVAYTYESDNGTGMYDYKFDHGKTMVSQDYKNGILHGQTIRYAYNGNKTVETTFLNGNQHGKRTEYFAESGKLSMEFEYAYDDRHGPSTAYWENGNKRWEENYYGGDLHGTQKYYYPNGTLQKEGTWEMGTLVGELKLYSDDGQLEIVRYYTNGILTGYSYLDKDGTLVPMIPFEHATGKFTAYYQNGNKSLEGEYDNGYLTGHVVEYFPDGKISEDENYLYGDFEGEQKYYYHNGNLKKEARYYGDELDGTVSYYHENGKLEHTEYHVLGDKFGTWVYYDEAGKETKIRRFYSDRQLSETVAAPAAPAADPTGARPKKAAK